LEVYLFNSHPAVSDSLTEDVASMTISAVFFLIAGMLLGAFFHLASRWVMGFLKPHTLSDVVQWEILASPSLIGTKDRSFIAVWKVRGPDLTFATSELVDNLAVKVKRLLRTLDDSTVLHVDAIRVPAFEYSVPESDVPAALRVMDNVRRARYERGHYFETTTYLALTLSPETASRTPFSRLLYTGDGASDSDSYDELIDGAERRSDDFESNIPSSLHAQRLKGDDLVSYLHTCLTGHHHAVTSPPEAFPSLRHIFSTDLQSGFEPHVGDHWFCVVGVWGYPSEVHMGVVQALKELSFPYRYSNRLVGLSQSGALAAIEKRQDQFQLQANDWLSLLSEDPSKRDPHDLKKDTYSQELAYEAKKIDQMVQGGARLLHHTGVVLVWDPSKKRAEKKARLVKKVLRNAGGGFLVQQEEGLGTEAFLGTLPGHAAQNPRRYLLLAESATRLLPILGTYAGPRTTPCSFYCDPDTGKQPPPLFYSETEEHTPFRFSPYGESGDVGHQMIVGPTGSGKSILLAFMAARQLHFPNGRSILFDRGHSFAPLCEALDGRHYDLSTLADHSGFMPLADIAIPAEQRWATSWLTDIAALGGLTVTPSLRNEVSKTLRDMAATSEEKHDPRYLTMQEFQTQVQSREFKALLQPFCGAGELGHLLNAHHDLVRDNNFIVIELGDLMDLDVRIFTPVLMYLFHKVETLLAPNRPTHVVADEFFVFGAKSTQGRDYVESALRTYRKKNAYITVATQSPNDLTDPSMSGIVNSIPTKIMLPNANALDPAQSRGYAELGLNPTQIEVLANSRPRRDYVALQPSGTRRFDLGLTAELSFMTPAHNHSLEKTADLMRDFKRRFGSRWIHHWFKYRHEDKHLTHVVLDRTRGAGRIEPLLLPEPRPETLLKSHASVAFASGDHPSGDGPSGDHRSEDHPSWSPPSGYGA